MSDFSNENISIYTVEKQYKNDNFQRFEEQGEIYKIIIIAF